MNPTHSTTRALLIAPILWICSVAFAFDSGSTGSDGAFNPTEDTMLTLPIDGTFNFTEVNIPAGVTVTFEKNLINSPVVWLVRGDVRIDGVIDISGNENGEPGPGGFRGGFGGIASPNAASDFEATAGGGGLGPGGGGPGHGAARNNSAHFQAGCKGAGAGHGSAGRAFSCSRGGVLPVAGRPYGRAELIPLLGGSGGGGGAGGESTNGSNGGGGGGALLIAASGLLVIDGTINADSGAPRNAAEGGCGGHGSAGAIRLVAATISGVGEVSAVDALTLCSSAPANGSFGRIRMEADSPPTTIASNPAYSFDFPQPLFIPDFPQLVISTIGGLDVPANPTGLNDVVLPVNTPNPITVGFTTNHVPTGSEISLRLTPILGIETTTLSTPTTGTLELATATASIAIPEGSSTLIGSVEFVVDAQASRDFAPYAEGQLVARIRTSYDAARGSITTFITQSGDEYEWPSSAIGIN